MMSKEMDEAYFRAFMKIIPTPELIAELERRRPCERCEHKNKIATMRIGERICIWYPHKEDNFKEAK